MEHEIQESTILDAQAQVKPDFQEALSDQSFTNIFNNGPLEKSSSSSIRESYTNIEVLDEGAIKDSQIFEYVTPNVVKEQLKDLTQQIEQIRAAKQEMQKVIKS